MIWDSVIVAAGQASIVTYVEGNGPDVVLLPSYGRDGGDDFDAIAAAVAGAGYRVLRPQPRGIAGSIGPMTGVSLADLGNDVAQVIGSLGSGPAVVLGHAFGNFVARTVATDHPDSVAAVVLAAASGRSVAPEVNSAPFRAGDPTLPEGERLAALRLAFFAPGHDPSAWLTGWYPKTLGMQHAAVTTAGRAGIDHYWDAGTAPVLEITAEYDPFNPRAQWGELSARLGPRVTSTVVANASHALFPEQPDAVAGAIIGYLKTLL
ncbi:MAG TPA: alpha/beta hydrolase [Pseudonocardia sp.]|nr:alpha/beta hydrolase [Pseudonocardia sp.]